MHEEGKLVEVEDIKVQKMNGNGMSVNRLLQYVQSMVHNKGLYLDETDIYNFHISVKQIC